MFNIYVFILLAYVVISAMCATILTMMKYGSIPAYSNKGLLVEIRVRFVYYFKAFIIWPYTVYKGN